MPTLSSLSQVTLPSGSVYEFKDAVARQMIADLTGAMSGAIHYVDETSTPLEEGSTASPIKIPGPNGTDVDYTPHAGDVVTYNNDEYIWSENSQQWREFGSAGSLKSLAFKDSASGSFTPSGIVSQPTFTGTQGTVSITGTPAGTIAMAIGNGTANYTPAGSVSQPTFTGTGTNLSVKGTPAGTIAMGIGNGNANYTPEGSVAQPTFTGTAANLSVEGTPEGTITMEVGSGTANYTPEGTVAVTPTITPATDSVTPIDSVGTLPELEFVVTGENLEINWAAGTLPTAGTPVDVVTGIESATAEATFTGTGVDLEATFSGTALTSTGSYTPEGTVSQPTFTGTGVDLEATFTGTQLTATGDYTPAGTISQPTFIGTQGTVTVS